MTTVADPSDRVLEPEDLTGPDADASPTFASLGVDPALVKALAGQGITNTFAIQAMTVADALAGRDVCGKAPTGSGKTLAFGLPLIMNTPTAPISSSASKSAIRCNLGGIWSRTNETRMCNPTR